MKMFNLLILFLYNFLGPYKVNGCPLRRVNQIYCIATTTKLDISNVNIPEHLDDKYFRRKKPQKKSKKDEEEIFDTKKEVCNIFA